MEPTTNGNRPVDEGIEEAWTYRDTPERQIELIEQAQKLKGDAVEVSKQHKESLLQQHGKNLAVSKANPLPMHIKQVIIIPSYPPSVTPFAELKKITLKNMAMETHHRGKYLVAKTITEPYIGTAIVTVLEDDDGTCVILTVHHLDDNLWRSVIPQGSVVAIKEPYCKFNGAGNFVIRVDHPSDIHIWLADDGRVPSSLRLTAVQQPRSAQEWKTAGDKAFLTKNHLEALQCYTQAIECSSKDAKDLVSDVLYKKANVNMAIGRFDAAQDDALASRNGGAHDKKAYHCAARAAYALEAFQQSKTFLESALKLDSENSALKREHARATARVNEQTNAEYDMEAMFRSVSIENNNLDNATYNHIAVVRQTASHGRGLFAARDIQPGEVVICDKAFYLPNRYGQRQDWEDGIFSIKKGSDKGRFSTGASLLAGLITKMYNNPSLNRVFLDMFGGEYQRSGKEGSVVDGLPVIDIFLIEAIRQKNCFSAPLLSSIENPYNNSSTTMPVATGFWVHSAFANHCCVPNTIRAFIGTHQVVRATCHIPKDAEITNQYIKPEADLDERQRAFTAGWGFACDCWLCSAEGASTPAQRKKRNGICEQARAEAMRKPNNPGRIPSSAAMRTVEKLTRQLELSFEPEIYDSLPRLLMVQPNLWLTEGYRAKKSWMKMLKFALSTLRSFGFMEPLWDGDGRLRTENCLVNIEAVRCLHYASEACGELGQTELAARFRDEARRGYVSITGTSVGVENIDITLSTPMGV